MESPLKPYFTEEYNLFYLWRPEPHQSKTQLAGEFKTEEEMQNMSRTLYGVEAVWREAQ